MTLSMKVPNTRLAAVMDAAKMSRKGLAARIRQRSQSDGGQVVSATHTLVSKWLSGEVQRPSERNCRLAAAVLSAALGRQVTTRDIGYADVQPEAVDTTLTYPDTITDSVIALRTLTRDDINGDQQRSSRQTLVVPQAWSELLVRMMYGGDSDLPSPESPYDLSPIHVRQVRDATEMFSTFDHRYGGGQSKLLVAKFLDDTVLPVLPLVAPDTTVGREYFQAAAELTLRAGWTAYDSGEHHAAQGYLIQAYRFAQAADDKAFSGHALACMSHQANYLGHFDQAVYLARAAVNVANGHATPAAMALFHAMEARGLASQGNEAGVTRALVTAEGWLNKRRPENEPDWIWFFDQSELDAEFAHCFRDLGNADLAEKHAAASISHAGDDFVRSSAFCRTVLAASHLLAGELDEALAIANTVVDSAAHLQSSRVLTYLTDFRSRLDAFKSPSTDEFNNRLRDTLQLERSPLARHIIVP